MASPRKEREEGRKGEGGTERERERERELYIKCTETPLKQGLSGKASKTDKMSVNLSE